MCGAMFKQSLHIYQKTLANPSYAGCHIILLKTEESWKGSTNPNLHRQFFIGNAIVFGQPLLRKPRGTLEYLRPVRLDELEICIRLKGGVLTISLMASQQVEQSFFADTQDWLN